MTLPICLQPEELLEAVRWEEGTRWWAVWGSAVLCVLMGPISWALSGTPLCEAASGAVLMTKFMTVWFCLDLFVVRMCRALIEHLMDQQP